MSAGPLPRVTAGRRADAATEASAARLTGPRREVLAALDACGPADVDAIAECWRSRQPSEGALGENLAEMVSRLLFKLEALGWVEPAEEGFAITELGVAVVREPDPSVP